MMKKLPLLISLLFLFACSQDNEMPVPQTEPQHIDLEVLGIVPLNDGNYKASPEGLSRYYTATKSIDTRTGTVNEIVGITPFVHDGDTLLYIVQKQQGWELLSADMRMPRTLMMCDTGVFDFENMIEPDQLVISKYAEQVYNLQNTPVSADAVLDESWMALSPQVSLLTATDPIPGDDGYWQAIDWQEDQYDTHIGPLITTKWHQKSPWNTCVPYTNASYTDRCLVGCVAVAGAQMLYYLHYKLGAPASFFSQGNCFGYKNSYSFDFTGSSSTIWNDMALSSSESAARKAKSAMLMGYVGSDIGIEYGATASHGKTKNLVGMFNSWGINCSYHSYNSDEVLLSLRHGKPVIVDGFRERTNILGIPVSYSGGHTWIIDGSRTHTKRTIVTYRWVYTGPAGGGNDSGERDEDGNPIEGSERTTIYTYHHHTHYFCCNWGTEGSSNNNIYYEKDHAFIANNEAYIYDNRMIIGFSKY